MIIDQLANITFGHGIKRNHSCADERVWAKNISIVHSEAYKCQWQVGTWNVKLKLFIPLRIEACVRNEYFIFDAFLCSGFLPLFETTPVRRLVRLYCLTPNNRTWINGSMMRPPLTTGRLKAHNILMANLQRVEGYSNLA